MSEGINIDAKQFYTRLNRIRSLWRVRGGLLGWLLQVVWTSFDGQLLTDTTPSIRCAQNPEDATTSLDGIGSILLVSGSSDEDNPYRKTTALQVGDFRHASTMGKAIGAYADTTVTQTWLLGYEFPSVLSLITQEKMIFVMSSGKGEDASLP